MLIVRDGRREGIMMRKVVSLFRRPFHCWVIPWAPAACSCHSLTFLINLGLFSRGVKTVLFPEWDKAGFKPVLRANPLYS